MHICKQIYHVLSQQLEDHVPLTLTPYVCVGVATERVVPWTAL